MGGRQEGQSRGGFQEALLRPLKVCLSMGSLLPSFMSTCHSYSLLRGGSLN